MSKDEIRELLTDFVKYQISYLTSHDDIKLEPIVESLVAQMMVDTKMCYLLEIKESEDYDSSRID
jgi:hypothetical protein